MDKRIKKKEKKITFKGFFEFNIYTYHIFTEVSFFFNLLYLLCVKPDGKCDNGSGKNVKM